ncbi:unnamed protein product [Ostreobium quekettii]|uniref:ABC transporter domain-containing protein n=1 Tax=Ostreobium quekettii TaxID=121088 RepID=A0A8S1J3Y6_9CHLO|nr:unnamed protein product [Ostreobium quekettii]|eukprot:evm.model.scf_250.8 EVM.evm.TU.scf_250.8   scf_250:73106-81186(-)
MPTDAKDKEREKRRKEKEGKDKKDSKEKREKKDKSGDREKAKDGKHRSSKDGPQKDKSKDRRSKDGGGSEGAASSSASSRPQGPRQPMRNLKAKKEEGSNYMAGMDLPPSSSEGESEEEDDSRKDRDVALKQATDKEQKKIADRERKQLEKALRIKEAALRDDDNVFDVSYEGQGEESTLSATDVKVHKLTVRVKGKELLVDTMVTISAGRRYGLVGPNGKGKSTLLRLLARRQIPVPENIDVLLVEQEVVGDERTALQAVVEADVELMRLRAEEQELMATSGEATVGDASAADSERLGEIYEQLEAIGAASAEARASKILHGLGFSKAMQGRPTNSFSGGWRMRISLARALYIQPTLLLLDEPTNHLDLRAVLWLEEYLQRWKKTLIVVSHDRDFLNNVTTDVIHLHDLGLHFYRGNFVLFESSYEAKRREVNKSYEKYEKQMKAAKSSGNKANQKKVEAQQKYKASKKSGKVKDKGFAMGEDAPPPEPVAPRKWYDYTVSFEFPEPTDLAPPLMQLIDADFKYPGRDDFGLHNVNIGIDMGSRVAIVGPNGAGKSTLMNLLAGDIDPISGEQRRNRKLRVGRYAQHFVDLLVMEETPVEYLLSRFPQSGLKAEQMRARLGRFGLSGHHHLQPICKLSGGQKARVVFTSISLQDPHILLFDEPTNHLDMQSIDALSDAVSAFQGGVVVISHDAQLLNTICEDEERSEVWVVEDGQIRTYPGDFNDYRNALIREIAAELDED